MTRRPVLLTDVSLLLYAVSLVMPAIVVTDGPLFAGSHDTEMLGIQCLISGFIVEPAWLANPLLLAAAVALSLGHRMVSAVLSGLALVLGMTVLVFVRYPHLGFFAWIGSMAALFAAAARAPSPETDRVRSARCA